MIGDGMSCKKDQYIGGVRLIDDDLFKKLLDESMERYKDIWQDMADDNITARRRDGFTRHMMIGRSEDLS
jgi:hypothetical protein